LDIQVVLTENDPKLGKRGQVVKVSSGYAQNFLFPHGKAKPATAANLKGFEDEKARAAKEEAERLAQANALASRLSSLKIELSMSIGEGGKPFGSVTSHDILEALSAQGVALDKKKLHLEEPIKKLGTHKVPVRLYNDVACQITVEVVKK
jgi:large subunit ribosomal protein L9